MKEPEVTYPEGGGRGESRLRINEDSTFYIVAPARVATGGPELLHQLAHNLRNILGQKAYMYYLPSNITDPVHPEYVHYNVPFVREIVDEGNNVLIVPEVTYGVKLLRNFLSIQKVVWWLSINNFIFSHLLSKKMNSLFLPRLVNKVGRYLFKRQSVDIRELMWKYVNTKTFCSLFDKYRLNEVHLHLCQSHYAMDFLSRCGVNNTMYLSDYLNEEFLQQEVDLSYKQDIVAFNPKKGISFTRKIISKAPDISFVPIEGMTRKQVIELLKKAKIYIDFGDHPGKDRIPREAVILGCCVIVGKRGAAANEHDMPIPDAYKFEVVEKSIPEIVSQIRRCIKNYRQVYADFNEYREMIKKEKEAFIKHLITIFGCNDQKGLSKAG